MLNHAVCTENMQGWKKLEIRKDNHEEEEEGGGEKRQAATRQTVAMTYIFRCKYH